MIFMLNALKEETNRTYTENGAATLQTSGSACLDLFATIGALRNARERDVIRRFFVPGVKIMLLP